MEIKQIRYFVTLAEEQSFSRAAARLHMTQPPLTRQIQQLEESMGVTLFERHNRGVTLTDAGQTFLAEARKLLTLAEQALDKTRLAEQGAIGRIDIGVFGSAILNFIPQLLLSFRARYPNVEVALYTMSKPSQIKALREGRLTIGFNRFMAQESDMVVESVLKEPLCVALPSRHALAGRASLSVKELEHEPFILFPNNTRPSLADEVVGLCRAEGFEPLVAQETSDVVSCIALVSTGFGIALAPASARSLQLPGVTYIPMAEPAPLVELSCMYRRGDHSPILMTFLDILRRFSIEWALKPSSPGGFAILRSE